MSTNNQSVFGNNNNSSVFGGVTKPSIFGSKDINNNSFGLSNNSNSNDMFKTDFFNTVNNQTSSFGNSTLFINKTKPPQIFGSKSSSNFLPKYSVILNNNKINQPLQSYQSKNTKFKDYVRCITLNQQENRFNLTKRQLMVNYFNMEQFQRRKKQAAENKSSSCSIPRFKLNAQNKQENKPYFLFFPNSLFKKQQNVVDIQQSQLKKDPLFNKLLQTNLFKKLQKNSQIKQIKQALNQIRELIKLQIDFRIQEKKKKQPNTFLQLIQKRSPTKSNQKLTGNIFGVGPPYFGQSVFGQMKSGPGNLFNQNEGFKFIKFPTTGQKISKLSNLDKEQIQRKQKQTSNISINQSIKIQKPLQRKRQLMASSLSESEQSQISPKKIKSNKLKQRKQKAKFKQKLSNQSEKSQYGNSSQKNHQIIIKQQQSKQSPIIENQQDKQKQQSIYVRQEKIQPKGRLNKKKQKKNNYNQDIQEQNIERNLTKQSFINKSQNSKI